MTFTSQDTYRRTKINEDIIRILRTNRGEWMTASEISTRIRGRTDSHGVGQRMPYLMDEYPIESMVRRDPWPWVKVYRYTGA